MIRNKLKELMTKTFLVGVLLGTMLSVVIISGCTDDTEPGEGRESDRARR